MSWAFVGLALCMALLGGASSSAIARDARWRVVGMLLGMPLLVAFNEAGSSYVATETVVQGASFILLAIAAGLVWRMADHLQTWTTDAGDLVVIAAAVAASLPGVALGPTLRGLSLLLSGTWALAGMIVGLRHHGERRLVVIPATGVLVSVGALGLLPWLGAEVFVAAVGGAGLTLVLAMTLHRPPGWRKLGGRLGRAAVGGVASVVAVAVTAGLHGGQHLLLPFAVGTLLVGMPRKVRTFSRMGHARFSTQTSDRLPNVVRETLVLIDRLTDPLAVQTQMVNALDDLFPGGRFQLLRTRDAPAGMVAPSHPIDEGLIAVVCELGPLTRDRLDDVPESVAAEFERLGCTLVLPVVCDSTVYGGLLVFDAVPQPEMIVQARRFADLLAYKLETHRLYTELEQKRRLATLGTFSAALAHDLRSPLATVRLNLQLVEQATAEPGDREAIADAIAALDRVLAELSGTLDFTRPLQLNVTSLRIEEVVDEVVGIHRADAVQAGVSVVVDCEDGLPTIRGDGPRLCRALGNLLRNAIEAAPEGTVVTVRAVAHKRGVQVQVCDEGDGIKEDLRDRIFEPFVTTKTSGIGLGLAVVKKVIERHRGTIAAHTNGERGTCMHVWVPGDGPH